MVSAKQASNDEAGLLSTIVSKDLAGASKTMCMRWFCYLRDYMSIPKAAVLIGDLQRTRNARRVSAPAGRSLREAESNRSEDEEVEANVGGHGEEDGPTSRYPSRRRSRVDHFDPETIYQARPRQRPKREVSPNVLKQYASMYLLYSIQGKLCTG